MKRSAILVLSLLLLLATTVRAAPEFDMGLVDAAKQALTLINYGEYKKALKLLNFSGTAPSAADFAADIEENLSDALYSVQTDVAVLYAYDKSYRLAIPVEEPLDRSVQALLLRSKDGASFDAYRLTTWGAVQDELSEANADLTRWCEAYDPGVAYIEVDS